MRGNKRKVCYFLTKLIPSDLWWCPQQRYEEKCYNKRYSLKLDIIFVERRCFCRPVNRKWQFKCGKDLFLWVDQKKRLALKAANIFSPKKYPLKGWIHTPGTVSNLNFTCSFFAGYDQLLYSIHTITMEAVWMSRTLWSKILQRRTNWCSQVLSTLYP